MIAAGESRSILDARSIDGWVLSRSLNWQAHYYTWKIKTTGPATIPPGGKVKSVNEAKAEFKIDFGDGSSATVYLANPGSFVAVRDKDDAVEYRA